MPVFQFFSDDQTITAFSLNQIVSLYRDCYHPAQLMTGGDVSGRLDRGSRGPIGGIMDKTAEKVMAVNKRDVFASVAVWQFMAFIFLLTFVWTSEILDLPALVFGANETPFNVYRASLLSAAVIVAGIIAVGHAYEKQRKLVKELMMTCLYCHRVKTDKGAWMHVEEYFLSHYPVSMDRSACPDCQKMLESVGALEKNMSAE